MSEKKSDERGVSPAWSVGKPGEDSEEKNFQVAGEVKTFFSETTAHGFSNIVKDEIHIAYRIVWIVVILAVMALACLHVTNIVTTYLQYPSQETTVLLRQAPKFPYVTVCNSLAQSRNRTATQALDSSTDLAQYFTLVNGMLPDLLAYEQENGVALDDIMLSPNGIFANIRQSEVRAIGHHLTDFILSCKYLDTDCDMENDWIQFVHQEYFNCYTYIGGAKRGKTASGPQNGLSLILYLENIVPDLDTNNLTYNIYSNVQNAFGAQLEVHEPKTLPTPSETGIGIMPGHSTSVGLMDTKIKKLPKPWGECTRRKKLKELKSYHYSAHTCLTSCLAKRIFEKCGCYVHYTPPLDDMPNNYQMCSYFDNATMTLTQLVRKSTCAQTQHRLFNFKQKLRDACDCRESCLYHTYDMTVSESIWPASLYHLDAFTEYVLGHDSYEDLLAYEQMGALWQEVFDTGSNSDTLSTLMYNNFARVNVYFQTMSVLEREELPSMDLWDLFANFGGTLGLWAGLSVCTMTEVILFFVRLCVVAGHKCRERRKIKQTSLQNTHMKNGDAI